MQEMSSMGIGNKPCLDIRPSKDQISDRSISFDQLSRSKYFSLKILGYIFNICFISKLHRDFETLSLAPHRLTHAEA